MRLGLSFKYGMMLALGLVLLGALIVGAVRGQQSADREIAAMSAGAMRDQGSNALASRGEALANVLAETLTNPLYYNDLDAIGDQLRASLREPDIVYIRVFDAKGRLVHDGSVGIGGFGLPMADGFAARASGANERLVQWSEQIVDVTQPIHLGKERIGGVRVGLSRARADAAIAAAASDLSRRTDEALAARWRLLALPLAGIALLAILGGWAVAHGLVRPIRRIAGIAQTLEQRRVEIDLASRRRDEIGDLERAMTAMSQSLVAQDRDIRRLAYVDSLTGLPNRLSLRETLEHAVAHGRAGGAPFALLFIDLDDFKRINDTLGHDAGDETLAQLARRFEGCLAAERDDSLNGITAPDMVARFGGDEFVALIGGSNVRVRAARVAERLLECVRDPLTAAGRPVFLNVSIGITVYPDDASAPQQMLKNGDIAMYQAKVHGKNCFRFFTTYMTKVADDRLTLEQDLREAMRDGALDVHYQPIYDVASGTELRGAEALLRWRHPERGLVPPSLFVALAEDFGLIDELGRFAMRRACVDAVTWSAVDGRELFVAVNISAKQLRRPGLVDEVASVLHSTGLDPERLHVELTESALLDDDPVALGALNLFRRLGVKIWLDDFGTGFSGLSHLRRVPVDGVKIDRSFTADLLTDHDDLALTSAIVAMAKSLGISAVAEGVESASQLDVLRGLKCDLVQGFWLSYPVDQVEMLEVAKRSALKVGNL